MAEQNRPHWLHHLEDFFTLLGIGLLSVLLVVAATQCSKCEIERAHAKKEGLIR